MVFSGNFSIVFANVGSIKESEAPVSIIAFNSQFLMVIGIDINLDETAVL